MMKEGKLLKKNYPKYFLIPAIIIFTLFYVVPATLGLVLSFTDSSVRSNSFNFIGLKNYIALFRDNGKTFTDAIGRQFLYAVTISIGKTLIGLLFALFLNVKFKGRNYLRALIYAPIMFSPVVIGILFNYILKYNGFFNTVLNTMGLSVLTRDWLGDFNIALWSVAGIDMWVGAGWSMVMILAALQSIPGDVLEVSQIDGAGPFVKFFKIKLPFIMHAINLCMLMSIISGLKAFDLIYTTTGGGPGRSTELLTTFLAKSLSSGSLGYPAAISSVQFVLITIVALIINKIQRRLDVL